MTDRQNWRTEEYKGMDVHVTALPHKAMNGKWDYTVRITDPGLDSSANAELASASGDNEDYVSEDAATEAGFVAGYALVDRLKA